MTTGIAPWEAKELVSIPADASPADVINRAAQLPQREAKQILEAFVAGSFEMVSSFVWQRAVGALRKQLALLGSDFIGEMLDRPDITEGATLEQKVTDFETLRLSQDLGMISATEAMRLRHALETLVHFHENDEDEEGMTRAEAETCLRACVQAVLGRPKVEVAVRFAELRRALEERDFNANDEEMRLLEISPHFFQRTALAILLARIRRAEGAQLEHVLANTNVILPLIWNNLRKPEKWQAGTTYAEVHAAGRLVAAAGLKRALMRVKGFDYVPENLRSRTYMEAAAALIQAHEGWNNFANEGAPAVSLAALGTSIPVAAIHMCISAALISYLGNRYGNAWSAEPYVKSTLDSLHPDRWKYYLEECLPVDRRVLEKFTETTPLNRWFALFQEYKLANVGRLSGDTQRLLSACERKDVGTATKLAMQMLS